MNLPALQLAAVKQNVNKAEAGDIKIKYIKIRTQNLAKICFWFLVLFYEKMKYKLGDSLQNENSQR